MIKYYGWLQSPLSEKITKKRMLEQLNRRSNDYKMNQSNRPRKIYAVFLKLSPLIFVKIKILNWKQFKILRYTPFRKLI